MQKRTLAILPKLPKKVRGSLIGTIHQPSALWQQGRHRPEMLLPLQALIVLSRREKDFFEQYLPGRTHFIPHGIDTNFFSPLPPGNHSEKKEPPRCVFSGTWLRDIETLSKTVQKIATIAPLKDAHIKT